MSDERDLREANIQAVLADTRQDFAMWLVAVQVETPDVVDLWAERIYGRLRDLSPEDLELAVVLLLLNAEGQHREIATNTMAFLRDVTT